ncbi:hypothetical protein AcW1_005002 [Taiwanofungus camphoratus]|nr:hypothetical protein AcW2_005988 [Antrodia cinnamomea]KAI0960501.1 hypothetical protein AcW1_005002 [Antrodia cinnamomea]
MPQLRDLSVSIVCDGKDLDEYDVAVMDERPVVCFIASEAGKTFLISARNFLEDEVVTFHCHMDGSHKQGRLCDPGKQQFSEGPRTSPSTYTPYCFTELSTTDDENIADPDDATLSALGCIEIRAMRVRRKYTKAFTKRRETQEHGSVHERSKMAGAHCVSLGGEIECNPGSRLKVKYIDPKTYPWATFKFLYRSRAMLQAQGIIPRPPPQSPEPAQISATSHDKGKKRAAAEPAETQPAMPPAKRTRTDQPAHAPAVQTGGAVKMEAEADVKPAIAPQGENVDLAAIKRQLQALLSNIEQIESGHQQASVGPRVKQEAIETKARQSAAVVIDLTDD